MLANHNFVRDHQVVSIVSVLLKLRVDSDSEEKMGDELIILLEAFHKIEKAGGQATLSLSTSSGKTKVKLEIPTTAAPPSVSPSQPASSTPGRRHRRRGARARARRNLQAATATTTWTGSERGFGPRMGRKCGGTDWLLID